MNDMAATGKPSPSSVVSLVAVALCVLAVGVAGEPPLDELRLIYVFNPDVDAHLERALVAQSLIQASSSRVDALGVVRGQLGTVAPQTRPPGIAFDLVSEHAVRAGQVTSPALSAWLALAPDLSEDRFILEDATRIRLEVAGPDLESLAEVLAPAADVMTRVETTTWGKMKELLQ